MDTIKRLIIKDLLALKSYKRLITMVFGMAIVFTFLGFYDKQMAMVTYTGLALPISILGGLANTILYEEEKANSDAFILTFPVNRKDIVLGKYLLNITLLLIGIFNYTAAPYAWYVEMYIGLFLMIPFSKSISN